MDFNAAACTFLVTQFALGALTERDRTFGLPCFIFYDRVFQLILKVWCGCYTGVAREFGFSDLECDFLFRWFQTGGVLDDDEIRAVLELALPFCSCAGDWVPETAWSILEEIVMFASQQGRLEQPWGINWVKWINRNKLSPLR
jgi:hypothetical protein